MILHQVQGFHDPKTADFVRRAWQQEELTIFLPPGFDDSSHVQAIQSVSVWPEKPILGVFTSGTISGRPRLILYSKKNLLASVESIWNLFDASRVQGIFSYAQPFHTFGLVLGYVLSYLKELPLYANLGKYSRAAHLEWLKHQQPGLLTLGTPTHFYDLLQIVKNDPGISLQPSYSAIVGGAQVSRALWTSLQESLKIESPSVGYGCSEASPGITHLPPGQKPMSDGDIGFVLPSVHATVNSELGVQISGPGLCLAVIQDGQVEFPKSLLIRDRIELSNQRWFYQGRLDLMLNRGGQKISLEILEQTLAERLDLEVSCVAVPSERLIQDLAVVVRAPEGAKAVPEKINSILKNQFGFHIPHEQIHSVARFPLGHTGKICRQSLQNLIPRVLA